MRIDRLDLIAYGPFTGRSLDLSKGSSGLHIIYGDNEAGKSTSLRALTAWLFGIPARTGDNFLHRHSALRVGGRLRLSTGRSIEFVRRKGAKDTLLDPGTGAPLEDSLLAGFLPAGMDEALFAKLYGIDHPRLVAGGRELLAQSGDLGQALYSAAIGTAGLRSVLSELAGGADEIYRPRASTRPLNQAIAGFRAARKRVRDSGLSVEAWKRLQGDLADTLALIERVEAAIGDKRRLQSRLQRLARVRGALAERRAVLAEIEGLGEVRLLPEDFDARRRGASERLRAATEARERRRAKLARLEEACRSLCLRDEVLENGEAIEAAYRELGAVEKAVGDGPKRDSERRLLLGEAAALLKGLRPDIPIGGAEGLRPLLNNRKWIADLVRRHSLLLQRREGAVAARREAERRMAAIGGELDSLPRPGAGLERLKESVSGARRAGDLDRRLLEARRRASEAGASCLEAFARLGRFSREPAMLLRTPMPVPETVDVFEERFDAVAGRGRDATRRRDELCAERDRAQRDLETLVRSGDVPDPGDLGRLRASRDALWAAVRRRFVERADAGPEAFGPAAEEGLPELYERKVSETDRLSDRMLSAADRVAKRSELEAKIENLHRRLLENDAEAGMIDRESAACLREWAAVWEPLGVLPGTPREMKQWMLRAEKLAEDLRAADAAAREADRLGAECAALVQELERQPARPGAPSGEGAPGLEDAIRRCELEIGREEAAMERRRSLGQALEDARGRLEQAEGEIRSAGDDLEAWEGEWRAAAGGLAPPEGLHPEQAAEAFDKLAAYFDRMDRAEELAGRIAGMDALVESFRRKVSDLAARVGCRPEGLEAAAMAARLNRELGEAREARAVYAGMEVQRKELAEEIADAGITIRSADQELAALREMAGASGDEDLERAGERSAFRHALRRKLEGLEQELARNGDGSSIRDLEEDAAGSDMDAVDGQLERVASELEDLHAERDDLRDRRQTLRDAVESRDGSAEAAAASEEGEQQLAGIAYGAEQYLRLRIAARILEDRIENYRKNNQAPVLSAAGGLFRRLTLGSYAELRDELDEGGRPRLLGVRPDGAEVPVEGMSDGTRDQLFLALRLAAMRQHLAQGETMPFVADDILVGFDDGRTAVGLEILAELAAVTQVLLFTHHRRVPEIAATVEAAAGVFAHDLACGPA